MLVVLKLGKIGHYYNILLTRLKVLIVHVLDKIVQLLD